MPRSSGRLIDFLQQHRNAGIGIGHRDAAAHRAGADDRRAADVARGRVLRAHRESCPLRARQRTDGASRAIRSTARNRRTARARAPSRRRSPSSRPLRWRRRSPKGLAHRGRSSPASLAPPGRRPDPSSRSSILSCSSRVLRVVRRASREPAQTRSRRRAGRRRRSASMMPSACARDAAIGLPSVHSSSAVFTGRTAAAVAACRRRRG